MEFRSSYASLTRWLLMCVLLFRMLSLGRGTEVGLGLGCVWRGGAPDGDELEEAVHDDAEGELDAGVPGCRVVVHGRGEGVDHPADPDCAEGVNACGGGAGGGGYFRGLLL